MYKRSGFMDVEINVYYDDDDEEEDEYDDEDEYEEDYEESKSCLSTLGFTGIIVIASLIALVVGIFLPNGWLIAVGVVVLIIVFLVKTNIISHCASSRMNDYKVYVLRCEPGNKYYVGYSSQLDKRISSHISGKGAKFTRVNKPIELIETYDCSDEQEAKEVEREVTISYAGRYGKRNVGGAGYYSTVR